MAVKLAEPWDQQNAYFFNFWPLIPGRFLVQMSKTLTELNTPFASLGHFSKADFGHLTWCIIHIPGKKNTSKSTSYKSVTSDIGDGAKIRDPANINYFGKVPNKNMWKKKKKSELDSRISDDSTKKSAKNRTTFEDPVVSRASLTKNSSSSSLSKVSSKSYQTYVPHSKK